MVVTGKARSKIRSSMKEEQRKKGELGKESLLRKLSHLKLDFENNIDDLVKHYDFKSRPELYLAVAEGKIKVSEINKFDIENGRFNFTKKEEKVKVEKSVESKKQKAKKKNKSNILVNGEPADQYNFSFATCCNPVQGDPIFGYLTASMGLKVHRINCPNATNLIANYGYRTLKAEWTEHSNNDFVVDILVTGVDSGIGVINALTNEISLKLGMNIRGLSIEGKEGYFEGKFSLIVNNINQLNQALIALENVEGVSTVTRITADNNSRL